MLECGIHPCPRKCHTSKCGDCEIMVNQTLRCACGSRVIPAPIKCGTEIPKCYNKCGKILPCGHPCLYDCHYGDCKPCQEIVDKKCACGKKTIEKSLCSLTMYCQNLCRNKLPCGHECGQNCHTGSCIDIISKKKEELLQQGMHPSENGCARTCGRIRLACGHPCDALCHPDSYVCPTEPCKYMVQVFCSCGNKSKFLECESTDKKIKKQLQCEEECRNLQRFRALYEKSQKKVYYPGFLVKYAKNNLSYIQKLEEKLMYFLIGNDKTLTFHVDKSSQERIKLLTTLLPKHYLLELLIYKVSKNAIITASKNKDSLIPKITLSQYLEKLNKGDVDVDPSPFDAKIWFYNLNFFENAQELDKHLVDVRDECYVEVDRAGHIKLYVWNKESIPAITKRLAKSGTGFAQFEIEEYEEKSEDESQLKVDIKQEDDLPKEEAMIQAAVLTDEPENPLEETEEASSQQTQANPEPVPDSPPQAAEQTAPEETTPEPAVSDSS